MAEDTRDGTLDALHAFADEQNNFWQDRSVAGSEAARAANYGELAGESLIGSLAAGARQTFVYDAYRAVKDSAGLQADPDFNPAREWDKISKDIPIEYHADLLEAESMEEVRRIQARATQASEDMKIVAGSGAPGMVAYMAGGIIDADLPIAFLSDGAYTAAKIGMVVKNARLASGISMGLSAGATVGALELGRAAINPAVDWTDVPQAAMFGMLAGTALGTVLVSKRHLQRVTERQLDDFHARMLEDPDLGVLPDPDNLAPPDRHVFWRANEKMKEALAGLRKRIAPEPDGNVKDTGVGAAINPNRPPLREDFVDDAQLDVISTARQWLEDTGLKLSALKDKNWLDTIETAVGRLTNDWYALGKTNSAVVQWIRHRMLESPTGRAGRTTTAAVEREMFQRQMMDGMVDYNNNYVLWARTNNPGAGMLDVHFKNRMRSEFDREVILEMNYRRLNNVEKSTNPHVKAAADALERDAKTAFDVQKRAGVDGFENIEYKRGYLPYRHSGTRMLQAMKNGTNKQDIIELYSRAYQDALGLPAKTTEKMAAAVVNRATKQAGEMDTSLHSLLTADGRAMLREALEANGVSKSEAKDIADLLAKPLEEKGRLGHTKSRNELDLNTEYRGLRLLDFMDTNITTSWNLYGRQASGAAALARMGITNRAMRKDIIDAALAEQNALGEVQMSRQFLEDIFGYFDAGPVHGGITQGASIVKKLTNLALLNKLGLSQAGELGATIAAVGWENFLAHSKIAQKFIKGVKAGNTEGLLDELAPWTGRIWEDHRLFDTSIDFTTERLTPHEQVTMLDTMTNLVNKGLRVQGFTSLFFQVRSMQTKLAMASMTDKVMRMLRDGVDTIGERRLDDIGLDKDLLNRIKGHIKNGDVEFMGSGFIDRLNMDKWAAEDAHDFAVAMTRFTFQVVQKDLIGESSVWMHKAYGSLLTHLQQFPMLAIQKQTIRNIRINDGVTSATLLYGLTTAGLAYAARQAIDGNTQNLDPLSIGRGALSMSNMTGWLPMLADGVGTMTGVDSLKMSNYGRPGAQFIPPTLDWFNKAVRVPGAIGSTLVGDATRSDISALKALPWGNMYGTGVLYGAIERE